MDLGTLLHHVDHHMYPTCTPFLADVALIPQAWTQYYQVSGLPLLHQQHIVHHPSIRLTSFAHSPACVCLSCHDAWLLSLCMSCPTTCSHAFSDRDRGNQVSNVSFNPSQQKGQEAEAFGNTHCAKRTLRARYQGCGLTNFRAENDQSIWIHCIETVIA